MKNNLLNHITPDLLSLSNLNHLDISANELSEFPHEIAFRDLATLFRYLQAIKSSDTLGRLDLEGFGLLDVPLDVLRRTALKHISMKDNQLNQIPESFLLLTSLNSVNLSENRLISLPTEFGLLTNLTTLSLQNNRLTYLP